MIFRCNYPSKYPDPDYMAMIRVVEYTPDKVIIEWCGGDIPETITDKKLIPLFENLIPGEWCEVKGKRDWKTDELTELEVL